VALRARPQVVEVELEDVVALHDVGIHLPEQVVKLQQQPLLARVRFLAQGQELAAWPALQPDRQHAVAGILRVAEGARLNRPGLDVELAAPQVGEFQIRELPGALLQQPLALVGLEHIDRRTLAHRLEKHPEGGQRLRLRQPVESPLTF
jgi:hypothetical protein